MLKSQVISKTLTYQVKFNSNEPNDLFLNERLTDFIRTLLTLNSKSKSISLVMRANYGLDYLISLDQASAPINLSLLTARYSELQFSKFNDQPKRASNIKFVKYVMLADFNNLETSLFDYLSDFKALLTGDDSLRLDCIIVANSRALFIRRFFRIIEIFIKHLVNYLLKSRAESKFKSTKNSLNYLIYLSISSRSLAKITKLQEHLTNYLQPIAGQLVVVDNQTQGLAGKPARLDLIELARLITFKGFSQKAHDSNNLTFADYYLDKSSPLYNRPTGQAMVIGSYSGPHLKQPKRQVYLANNLFYKHQLIVGSTGMGKTTLMSSQIQQLINYKYPLAVIDPHGDLATTIYNKLTSAQRRQTTYILPDKLADDFKLNLLEIPAGLDEQTRLLAEDYLSESIITIFRKLFSADDLGGHRIEYVLRKAIYTAFSIPDANLFSLIDILTNKNYRLSILDNIEDIGLKNFWLNEYGRAGDYQQVKMISGITAKLGRFYQSRVIRNIIDCSKSSINFNQLLTNRLLIANLAKGRIGEDNASLLGMILIAKIQLAAWRRALVKINKRQQFFLFIDEFQNFDSASLSQLVSEGRKFKISLTLAEQTSAFQEDDDFDIMQTNIANYYVFNTTSQIDHRRLSWLFNHDDQNLVNFSKLAKHQFIAKIQTDLPSKPVSLTTILK